MRNFATAASATVTAVIIAMLIANVASAARAAEIDHDKQQRLAALQDSINTNDVMTQLEAYRTRYAQAYERLAAAYQLLYSREAEYRAALDKANATSGQLSAADASLETRLNEAYAALRDAQALVNSMRVGGAGQATAAPTAPFSSPPAGTAGPAQQATAQPTATRAPSTATPRPTPTMYCWYDSDGKWVCEDHPRGG